MKVIKKTTFDVPREDAHGGSGGRRLFVSDKEISNFQGLTYGYLPVGRMFDWHNHEGLNEVMYVVKGSGVVRDEDGEYPFAEGDFFVLPNKVVHQIENTCDVECEMVFVRVYGE